MTRETSSGSYIPEIDGLRFIAISTVILFHSYTYFNVKSSLINDSDNIFFEIWTALCQNGYIGVYLFFAISGYILGKPFAEQYIQNGSNVSIKKYFFRRLTRIEPPYFIALISFFVLSLLIYDFSFKDLLYHFLAGFFYIHNLVFAEANPINGVLWSLEVEIQFYILAPLICLLYKLNKFLRWVIWTLLILIFSIISIKYDPELMGFKTIVGYFHYFLADIDASKLKINESISEIFYIFLGLAIFSFLLFTDLNTYPFLRFMYSFMIIIFYYLVLKIEFWKKIFSIPWIAVVGGMCYTIYLLHYKIISFIGSITIPFKISNSFIINYVIQILLYTFFIALGSIVFYLLIERPTMKKEWYKKFFVKRKSII